MDVEELDIIVLQAGEERRATQTVAGLMDLDGDMRPELERGELTYGVPLEIVVEGYIAGRVLAYVGRIGPIVLAPGERRHVDLAMYPLEVSTNVAVGEMPARFLHTATSLADGRVLISGGFSTVRSGAACPMGLPAETRCFDLVAASDAWLFDSTTGRFWPVARGMLAARGGHTATALPDGRVLIAGGAERAIFALAPQGASTTGFVPAFFPFDAAGADGAHANFELFDPFENAELVDADRDGDPARGGFIGGASDLMEPGLLNNQRFLHAAAAVPNNGEQVLLAGGLGPDRAAMTYEVFDARRPGGHGVYDNDGVSLLHARVAPAAIGLSSPTPAVWIVGNGGAEDNDGLAEIWEPDPTNVNGTVRLASETTYPNPSSGNIGERASYDLVRPNVAAVDDGASALVLGWLGPRCRAGEVDPIYPGAEAVELCGHTGGPLRGHTINGLTGATLGTDTVGPHAFGASVTLGDGRVALSGGIASIIWNNNQVIEVFDGTVASGIAQLTGGGIMMRNARAFHQSTALLSNGILTTGGMNLSTDARNLTLLAASEVLFLR